MGWRDLSCIAFLAYAHRVVEDVLAQRSPGDEYARDTWTLVASVSPRAPNYLVRFGGISQLWLREAARPGLASVWQLAVLSARSAMTRTAQLVLPVPRVRASRGCDEGSITRPVLEEYLSHLASAGLADQTRLDTSCPCGSSSTTAAANNSSAVFRRGPALSRRHAEPWRVPAPICPEPVMAKLESAENLAASRRHHASARRRPHRDRLRASDACNLAIDAVVDDSVVGRAFALQLQGANRAGRAAQPEGGNRTS